MRTLIFSFLVLGLTACSSNLKENEPGDPLGSYALSADADLSSSCIELLNASPRPWTFDVTLRRDGATGYWVTKGSGPIEGTIDTNGAISFKQTTPITVHGPDKARELGTCVVAKTDEFVGTLAGAPNSATGLASFSGTLRYSYQVVPGADCRDIVGGSGLAADPSLPHFSTLPCDVRYAVTATRTGDVK
ncbi:MAG: hypothetical protein ACXVEE_14685 [Polyangiales bacterium]